MIDLSNIQNFATPPPGGRSVFGNANDFAALPETHQQQILFLDKTAKQYLLGFTGPSANLVTGSNWDPFAKGNFGTVEECPHLSSLPDDNQLLKKWLFKRGIPFKTWVFVVMDSYDPVMITWKMLVKYAPLVFFGGDVMVFDRSMNWCLFYFHENQLFFGKDNQYDSTENDAMMQALNERKKNFPAFKHPYL